VIFTNCKIYSNEANHGGGVYIESGDVTFTNTNIYQNTAKSNNGGGGGISIYDGDVTFTNCDIYSNDAGLYGQGGGVSVDNGDVIFTNCNIYENTAGDGANLYIKAGALVSISPCTPEVSGVEGTIDYVCAPPSGPPTTSNLSPGAIAGISVAVLFVCCVVVVCMRRWCTRKARAVTPAQPEHQPVLVQVHKAPGGK